MPTAQPRSHASCLDDFEHGHLSRDDTWAWMQITPPDIWANDVLRHCTADHVLHAIQLCRLQAQHRMPKTWVGWMLRVITTRRIPRHRDDDALAGRMSTAVISALLTRDDREHFHTWLYIAAHGATTYARWCDAVENALGCILERQPVIGFMCLVTHVWMRAGYRPKSHWGSWAYDQIHGMPIYVGMPSNVTWHPAPCPRPDVATAACLAYLCGGMPMEPGRCTDNILDRSMMDIYERVARAVLASSPAAS